MLPFEEFVDALTEATFRPLSHLTPYQTDGVARMQEHLRQLPGHGDVIVTASELSVVTHLLPTASAIQWSLVNQTTEFGARAKWNSGKATREPA